MKQMLEKALRILSVHSDLIIDHLSMTSE